MGRWEVIKNYFDKFETDLMLANNFNLYAYFGCEHGNGIFTLFFITETHICANNMCYE